MTIELQPRIEIVEDITYIEIVEDNTTVEVINEIVDIIEIAVQGPPGPGLIDLGLTNQILQKKSNESYDTEWVTNIGLNYVHAHNTLESQWNIEHNLNKYPSVTVIDSANTVIDALVEYIDTNKIKIYFGLPFVGKALLN